MLAPAAGPPRCSAPTTSLGRRRRRGDDADGEAMTRAALGLTAGRSFGTPQGRVSARVRFLAASRRGLYAVITGDRSAADRARVDAVAAGARPVRRTPEGI